MTHLLIILPSLALFGIVTGYPEGAPPGSCISMFPTGHNTTAKTSTAPYTITTSSKTFANMANITVTLTPTPSSGYYEGVFIQARRAKCGDMEDEAVGTFSVNDALLKTINCGTATGNAVSHSTKAKKKILTFTWMPPASFDGTIYFRGTFVKETDEFWTNVYSDFLNGAKPFENPRTCASHGERSVSPTIHILCAFAILIGLLTW